MLSSGPTSDSEMGGEKCETTERNLLCKQNLDMSDDDDDDGRVTSSSPLTSHDDHSLGGVIVDIAACDGPVFFERVINKQYSSDDVSIVLEH